MSASSSIGTVRRADRIGDYQRFGVVQATIEGREDGMRESHRPGSFEWWYFDVHLDNEAWIVVSFMTKPLDEPMGELQPVVTAKIKMKDEHGQDLTLGGECSFANVSFVANPNKCDVTIGPNTCVDRGQGKYVVEFRRGDIDARIELDALVPPARIGTGHLLFEKDDADYYLGWLVAVPHGRASAKYVVNGKPGGGVGTGYHDHNWGNSPMNGQIHHWYWGRAVVGDFVVIAANVTAQGSYGGVDHTDLVLLEGGKFLALGNLGVSFQASAPVNDPTTGKPVSDLTSYTFLDAAGGKYIATFKRLTTVLTKIVGGAAYHRFGGFFTLQVIRDGTTTTLGPQKTTWELMWFGDQPHVSAFDLYARVLTEPKGF
jgi:hypothetical protein